ncbi:hypothetical protein JAO99_001174 [Campylobacter coli]|nr:hypothetical protein [Campylobacter coli]
MADMIDSGKISFACELDKDLETPTTESNTEARITFTETQIVLGLGNDKSIKYKATGQGTDLTNYYNKSQVDEKLKLKADKTQLSDYYNKGEVDSALDNKVDTTTLTTNHYNKTETDNLLNNKADKTVLENYYNKSDIDGKLTNKVDTTTLDNYDLSTEVDNKVKVVSDKVGDLSSLETGVKNTVVAAINEVKRAQTEAGKVTNLNDLGDVNASAPRRGQFLGWDQDTNKWVSKDVETDGMDIHMADFNNPHRTTISNLNDTTISTPKADQVLAYNGTKWINKDVSLDDSNYAKKNEANIFTKPQVVPNATDATHAINKGQFDSSISDINTNIESINTTLGNKVTKTGNETIGGTKTFSSPIIIPNATANNHALNRVTADGRYSKLLVENLTWTVGTGGKFTNINDALNEASRYKFLYKNAPKITIVLKSGYEINTDLIFNNGYYGFIELTSEDDFVNYTESGKTLFFVTNFSTAPIINLKIKGNNSIGSRACLVECGFMFIKKNKGFLNFEKGIQVNCGFLRAVGSICSGCTVYALYASQNGNIDFMRGDLSGFVRKTGENGHNIYCGYASNINMFEANLSNSTDLSINGNGGYIKATSLNMSNSKYTQGHFINCYAGSIIDTTGTSTSITGGGSFSNVALNNFTSNGIVIN